MRAASHGAKCTQGQARPRTLRPAHLPHIRELLYVHHCETCWETLCNFKRGRRKNKNPGVLLMASASSPTWVITTCPVELEFLLGGLTCSFLLRLCFFLMPCRKTHKSHSSRCCGDPQWPSHLRQAAENVSQQYLNHREGELLQILKGQIHSHSHWQFFKLEISSSILTCCSKSTFTLVDVFIT